MEIRVAVGQEADFKIRNQAAYLPLVEQKRGNRNQRRASGWNAFAEVELGQRLGIKEGGDRVVYQIDRALHGRQQENQRSNQAIEQRRVGQRQQDECGDKEDGDELNAGDVEILSLSANHRTRSIDKRGMVCSPGGKMRKSLVEEIIADMDMTALDADVAGRVHVSLASELERSLRHLQ